MNHQLQSLLRECGWTTAAENPNFVMASHGADSLRILANSLDMCAARPENAALRPALEAARDAAAEMAWPPPLDWRAEFAALVKARR